MDVLSGAGLEVSPLTAMTTIKRKKTDRTRKLKCSVCRDSAIKQLVRLFSFCTHTFAPEFRARTLSSDLLGAFVGRKISAQTKSLATTFFKHEVDILVQARDCFPRNDAG
jgi:hypothetical protein